MAKKSTISQGNAILNPDAVHPPNPVLGSEKSDFHVSATTQATPGVSTFVVRVLDSTPPVATPHALPETNATMAKLLDQVRQTKFLELGTLPTFPNTELAALGTNYAASAGSVQHEEPAELTELQWDAVLKNNRALHGYYTDFDKGILVKAPKPTFRLRSMAAPGTPVETPKTGGVTNKAGERFTEGTISLQSFHPIKSSPLSP